MFGMITTYLSYMLDIELTSETSQYIGFWSHTQISMTYEDKHFTIISHSRNVRIPIVTIFML